MGGGIALSDGDVLFDGGEKASPRKGRTGVENNARPVVARAECGQLFPMGAGDFELGDGFGARCPCHGLGLAEGGQCYAPAQFGGEIAAPLDPAFEIGEFAIGGRGDCAPGAHGGNESGDFGEIVIEFICQLQRRDLAWGELAAGPDKIGDVNITSGIEHGMLDKAVDIEKLPGASALAPSAEGFGV